MPNPNAERAYELWQSGQRAMLRWDPAAVSERPRRRRVLPATLGLAVGLRLVPLAIILILVILFGGQPT